MVGQEALHRLVLAQVIVGDMWQVLATLVDDIDVVVVSK